jgi:hypothetical protein
MANMTVTNNDRGNPIISDARYRDDSLYFATAGTVAAGTLLARKAVEDAIVAAADGGNTGDGTCTAAAVVTGPVVPLIGAYNLECVEAIADGGRFKLVDPNGMELRTDLLMTAGAGAATVFEVEGMTFTLTDGATNFIVGDKFSLTVAADGQLYPFATDGLGGVQEALTVAGYDMISATDTTAIAVRVPRTGNVVKERLIIAADGDGSNITNAILDQLVSNSIIPGDVLELTIPDNQ